MSEIGRKLIAETRRVAEEAPDFVYREQSCRYVVNGKPSCLIGHALWNLGLIDKDLESASVNDDGVLDIQHHLGIDLEQHEYEWLCQAQSFQDTRRSWGVAIDGADTEIRQLYGFLTDDDI